METNIKIFLKILKEIDGGEEKMLALKTKYKFFRKILVLFSIYIYNKQQKKWR